MKIRILTALLASAALTAGLSHAEPLLAATVRGTGTVNIYKAKGAFLLSPKNISVGKTPRELCASPDGSRLFVGETQEKKFTVIDLKSLTILGAMNDPAMKSPDGCAVSTDGKKLYGVDAGGKAVAVFNIESRQLITRIPVGDQPRYAVVSPDGKTVVVSNAHSHNLSVIDTGTDKVVKTVKTGREPRSVVYTADKKFLAVGLIEDDAIAYFHADTLEFDQQVGVMRSIQRIEIDPKGNFLFALSRWANSVAIVSMTKEDNRRLLHSVPVGQDAFGMAMSADGRYIYTSHTNLDNTISVMDTTIMRNISSVRTGDNPFALLYIK